jgi:hypothetical protein
MPSFKIEYILDQLQMGQTTGSSNLSSFIPGASQKLMLASYGTRTPSGREVLFAAAARPQSEVLTYVAIPNVYLLLLSVLVIGRVE